MNALAKYLILVVLVSSFLQVLNPNLVEARNLISHASFKADLIRRKSSPLSLNHKSSMTPQERHLRATLGSVSLGHNIRLSSTYFDQKDVNTDIVPDGGDYLMKISIGTPPVEFTPIVDTGSDLIWVQCSPCSRCIQQQSPLFEPNKSSTYHTIPCNSQSCNYPDFNSGCIPNNINNDESCAYSIAYGDGTKSRGILSTDTISFSLADATKANLPSSTFGCGYDQQGNLAIYGYGIVGLGRGTSSLVSQLGPKINYKFSYCLTPLLSNSAGKIQFGLDVTQAGVVSTPFTTQTQNSPTFYTLTLNGISIGNSSIAAGQDMIIDSGTTYTFLPTNIYGGVRAAMKGAIGLSPVPDPNNVLDPCYEAQPSGEGFNPPDVVFHFKGADVVLKAVNTFRKQDNLVCLAIVPSDDTLLFGNIAQVNYEVGYDLKAKQVSFAPADCTKY